MSAKSQNPHTDRPERALRPGWFCVPRLVRVGVPAPEYLRGMRLLFVSDVHLRRQVSDAQLAAFVDQLAAVDADLLLLGGDYAESPRDCRRFFRALGGAFFPLGAFAVPGNNDRESRDELRAMAADGDVTLLVNESRRVTLPGGTLEIGGCDDHKYGVPRTADLFPANGGFRVLLSHFPAPPDCDCDLMLSGHTHAGQLRLFGLTPYSLGFEREFHLLALDGLQRIGNMHLLVSGGVGVSRIPLRVNAEPEIHLVEFTN